MGGECLLISQIGGVLQMKDRMRTTGWGDLTSKQNSLKNERKQYASVIPPSTPGLCLRGGEALCPGRWIMQKCPCPSL